MSFIIKLCRISLLLLILSLPKTTFSQASAFIDSIQNYRVEYKKKFLEYGAPFYGDTLGVERMQYFAPDTTFLVRGQLAYVEDDEPFDMPTYSGDHHRYQKHATFTFEYQDSTYTLILYRSMRPGNSKTRHRVFIPFKDLTNGESTYGGGRYIYAYTYDLGKDDAVLDFNVCFNPYCAYKDGYSCPIPPKENHLPFAVEAGEKAYPRSDKK